MRGGRTSSLTTKHDERAVSGAEKARDPREQICRGLGHDASVVGSESKATHVGSRLARAIAALIPVTRQLKANAHNPATRMNFAQRPAHPSCHWRAARCVAQLRWLDRRTTVASGGRHSSRRLPDASATDLLRTNHQRCAVGCPLLLRGSLGPADMALRCDTLAATLHGKARMGRFSFLRAAADNPKSTAKMLTLIDQVASPPALAWRLGFVCINWSGAAAPRDTR